MGIGDWFRNRLGKTQAAIGQAAVVERREAQAAAQVESRETQFIKRFMSETNAEIAHVRLLIRLADERKGIEQKIANNSQRAFNALGRFQTAASVVQKIAQRGRRIMRAADVQLRAGGAAPLEANAIMQEAQQLDAEVAIALREAEAHRLGLRNFVQLSNNLTTALQTAEQLARRYAGEFQEVPVLEDDDKALLTDLNQVAAFAAAQRQRAKAQMQLLRK